MPSQPKSQTDFTKWWIAQLHALAEKAESGEFVITGAEIDHKLSPVPTLNLDEKAARWKRTGISTYTITFAEKALGPS